MNWKSLWPVAVALCACDGGLDPLTQQTNQGPLAVPAPIATLESPGAPSSAVPIMGDKGKVQIIHLSPDAPAVDVVVNDSRLALADVEYLGASPAFRVNEGTYELGFPVAGEVDPVFTGEVEVVAGLGYTVVAFDALENIRAGVITNSLSDLPDGFIRLQVVHTAVGVADVDVWDLDSGAQILDDFDFGYYASLDLPRGPLNIGLDLDEDAVPDVTFSVPGLGADKLINVFVVNDDVGVALYAVDVNGTTARVDADPPPGAPPEIMPNEGLYERTDATVDFDNCGLLDPATWTSDLDMMDYYLPDRAGVMPGDDSFLWREAEDALETRGAVNCEFDGFDFSCETQSARQLTTYSLYSSYEIDVTGEVLSEDSLETEATVRIIEVDTFTAATFASVGIDFTECEMVANMTWERIE